MIVFGDKKIKIKVLDFSYPWNIGKVCIILFQNKEYKLERLNMFLVIFLTFSKN